MDIVKGIVVTVVGIAVVYVVAYLVAFAAILGVGFFVIRKAMGST